MIFAGFKSNPASTKLFISTKNGEPINEITIYNQLGQKVLHEKRVIDKIDVSTLEQGLYIIEIVSSNLKVREKLIINKL